MSLGKLTETSALKGSAVDYISVEEGCVHILVNGEWLSFEGDKALEVIMNVEYEAANGKDLVEHLKAQQRNGGSDGEETT